MSRSKVLLVDPADLGDISGTADNAAPLDEEEAAPLTAKLAFSGVLDASSIVSGASPIPAKGALYDDGEAPPPPPPKTPLPFPESLIGSAVGRDVGGAAGVVADFDAVFGVDFSSGVIVGGDDAEVEEVVELFCGNGGAVALAARPAAASSGPPVPAPIKADAMAAAFGDRGKIGVLVSKTSPGP